MKKIKYFVVSFSLLLFPFMVKAEGMTLCQNGCDYSSLDTLLTEESNPDDGVIIINVKDSFEYEIGSHDLGNTYFVLYSSNDSNINITGVTDSTQISSNVVTFGDYYGNAGSTRSTVKLKNIVFNVNDSYECDMPVPGMCSAVYIGASSIVQNVTVKSRYSGLELRKEYTHNIDNYTFVGDEYGIVVSGNGNRNFVQRSINISNSKLAGCNCSLLVYDLDPSFGQVNSAFSNGNSLMPVAYTGYDIKVDSSEVNCAKYSAVSSEYATNPTVYFTSSNKWLRSIERGTDINSYANVVEGFNSKIIIDFAKQDTISLSDNVSIIDYFEDLSSVNIDDITWIVSDPSILKIENGKVIPLKAGKTQVTASYNNMNYIIDFRVTGFGVGSIDVTNPKTGGGVAAVLLLLMITGIVAYTVAVGRDDKKVKA